VTGVLSIAERFGSENKTEYDVLVLSVLLQGNVLTGIKVQPVLLLVAGHNYNLLGYLLT